MFAHPLAVIAMIHVPALPGTPGHSLGMKALLSHVREEAQLLLGLGVDAVVIENMHDRPYLRGEVGAEIVTCMTRVAVEVKTVVGSLPCGIQILAGANKEALAVAYAAGLDFIRAEAFVFSHVADEGLMDACAGELLRYRKFIGAERIQIWADIKKKHASHAITSDVSLSATALAAEFCLADSVVVTGSHTGQAALPEDVREAAKSVGLPVYIGSGITAENVEAYAAHARGFIVGSSLKQGGQWHHPIDASRVKHLVETVRRLRNLPRE